MVKTRLRAFVAAVIGGALFSTSAQAIPSLEVIWRSSGTPTLSTLSVTASGIVIADLVLHNDLAADGSEPVIGVFVTIEFDADELQAISMMELREVRLVGFRNSFRPLSPGPSSIDNVGGSVFGFEQQTLTFGCCRGAETLGSVTFHVVPAAGPRGNSADIDVIASLANQGVDAIVIRTGPDSVGLGSAHFTGASLTPEPTSALLLAAGLVALGCSERRRRYVDRSINR